jgi:predicted N-acetyltransferase YhbS
MFELKTGITQIDFSELSSFYLQAGLGDRPMEMLKNAFSKSYKVLTAYSEGKIVGAGRMLSDGVIYAMIFDVAVLPEFRKQGLGRDIMEKLLDGERDKFVHLTSTFGHEDFYKKLGFKKHKTAFALYPFQSDYLE